MFRGLVVMLLGSAILVPFQCGTAATISVNTYGDVVANDGKCSLREAVTAVNTSAASGIRRLATEQIHDVRGLFSGAKSLA